MSRPADPARMPPAFDLSKPDQRRRAEQTVRWKDHGILRTYWHNFAQVTKDAYRSNYPDHARLSAYRDMGIKAVLNLRGARPSAAYLLEAESCAALDLPKIDVRLTARKAPAKEVLKELFAAFDTIPRPFLMHCKSGADRAGLAAALFVLDEGGTIAAARAQLSLRFVHLKFTRTGIQDHLVDLYAARVAESPIGIRDWVATEYDPAALTRSFARKWILPV